MKKFTIISDYSASGEGRTLSLMLCLSESKEDALIEFKKTVGEFFAYGAEIHDGFNFENDIVKFFITPVVRSQLEDDRCNKFFSAQLHFNYS